MNTQKSDMALQPNDSIAAFRGMMLAIAEHIYEAAQMLARLQANDPDTLSHLSRGPNALSEKTLGSLLRIAEGSLHPELLLNRSPAYLKIAKFPYSAQEAIITKGKVEVATGFEPRDVILVDLTKLEGPQLKQVMGAAGVRSTDDQRAWLRSRQPIHSGEKVVGPAYHIRRDKLVLLRPCELSKVEILRLLEEMVA